MLMMEGGNVGQGRGRAKSMLCFFANLKLRHQLTTATITTTITITAPPAMNTSTHRFRSGTLLLPRYTPPRAPHAHSLLKSYATTSVTPRNPPPPPAKPSSTDTVNSPLRTIPAPISLPERTPDASTFSHLYRVGRAYLAFFKTGFSSILHNYRATRALQELADKHGLPTLVASARITRSEYQHLVRARHDILRVPAFGLIFILCGDLSPFILPFVPMLVPYPCRIPQQLSRQRRLAGEKREKAYAALVAVEPTKDVAARELEQLSSAEVAHVAKVLGVDSVLLPLEGLRRYRVAKRVEYLALDDALLQRGGGAEALDSGEELVMAAQERGIDTFGRKEREIRDALGSWEKVTKSVGGVKPGVWLLRPESWAQVAK